MEPEACAAAVAGLQPDHMPSIPTGPDVKWRYMWRVRPRPAETQYAELNADPVIPKVGRGQILAIGASSVTNCLASK